MKQLQVLQSEMLPLKSLKANTGQIPGLPANPRSIDAVRLAKLKESLKQNPEMLALREILVFKYEGENVVIGGNQRIVALADMNIKKVPCKVIPEDTSVDQLRAYLIKDNVEFGEWVDDMLKADWKLDELDDFGMEDVDRLDEVIAERQKADAERRQVAEVGHNASTVDNTQPIYSQHHEQDETQSSPAPSSNPYGSQDNIVMTYRVEVTCDNEIQQEELYNSFRERGLECRILTL